ncbi:MAG TPA: hypothetical protein VIG75_08405, partial [Citricoccus sp.]
VLSASLTSCSGGAAEVRPTPSTETAAAVEPDGVVATEPGTALEHGDAATLVWQPTADLTGALELTVEVVQERRASVFDGWVAGDSMGDARPYFVSVDLTKTTPNNRA